MNRDRWVGFAKVTLLIACMLLYGLASYMLGFSQGVRTERVRIFRGLHQEFSANKRLARPYLLPSIGMKVYPGSLIKLQHEGTWVK